MNTTLLDLYTRLPISIKRVGVAIKGARHYRFRYGSLYRSTLAELRDSEKWPQEAMDEYQKSMLNKLMNESLRYTSYYGDNIEPHHSRHACQTLDLSVLPILEKTTLKRRRMEFLNSSRKTVVSGSTSGSTGSPLVVEYDRESIQQRFAFMHRHREWAGVRPFSRSVRLSGNPIVNISRSTPPYWIYNPAERQLIVSTYHMSDDKMDVIFDKLQRFVPEIIDGYPSAVLMIARHANRYGKRIESLKSVITTAETLDVSTRREIEEGLGVQVLDYYAASEGVPLIHECVHGRYHIRPESGLFEILDRNNNPVGKGETGELVVTSFAQWRMPLIRYKTGDYATASVENDICPCGCLHPTVGRIVGRQEDMIYTTDGRWIGMVNYRTLKTLEGVVESQLEQTAPDRFVARIVLSSEDKEQGVRAELEKKMWTLLGYDSVIEYEILDKIPRGSNGKLRSIIRTFNPDDIKDLG